MPVPCGLLLGSIPGLPPPLPLLLLLVSWTIRDAVDALAIREITRPGFPSHKLELLRLAMDLEPKEVVRNVVPRPFGMSLCDLYTPFRLFPVLVQGTLEAGLRIQKWLLPGSAGLALSPRHQGCQVRFHEVVGAK
ncbi:hypothetical protein F5X68DRAFT_203095 [Plectosphaerella plurivora]|uniref:Secreted protein n=1 Tax=Plectosphaerella plurivora TaxID=936078 RepID=A0A9P9AD44_9PEZI|nr:hypothetical protein F5X68DRAFT_203095 [Plectosphaerella plurivora]